ncbi:MAG: ABC transporter ATP-binding protein [Candidatus Asgardarchaeia archaeon]
MLFELSNVTKIYRIGKAGSTKSIYAVRDVNLKINESEFVTLFGPSGSGKTTLLMLMAAIIKPTSGSIIFDGEVDITKFSENEAAKWRRENIGFVFQKINLVNFLNVLDNTLLPIYPLKADFNTYKRRAEELLEYVGLADRINHKPSQLSVGEQQRVALVRALINSPKVVFADEPTAHLDTKTGKKIIKLMKKLNNELGVTFIVSTHDPEIVSVAGRIVKIRDGKIISEQGNE